MKEAQLELKGRFSSLALAKLRGPSTCTAITTKGTTRGSSCSHFAGTRTNSLFCRVRRRRLPDAVLSMHGPTSALPFLTAGAHAVAGSETTALRVQVGVNLPHTLDRTARPYKSGPMDGRQHPHSAKTNKYFILTNS